MRVVVCAVVFFVQLYCPTTIIALRGPPVVEKAPLLLNSYIPAAMQIIAHYTDLMKYEIKPIATTTTTRPVTTEKPTSPHPPAVVAPYLPPGAAAYYSRHDAYKDYVEKLQNYHGYFDRYYTPTEEQLPQPKRTHQIQKLPEHIDLLGSATSDLLQRINTLDYFDDADDDDGETSAVRFTNDYDDFNIRSIIIGMKKPPPVKAYVLLLQLYDQLNQESKKLQLNKYGGYTHEVLVVLQETSTGTAAEQLNIILGKIVEHRDTNDGKILKQIKQLRDDLEMAKSYLNEALRYIPPLQYAR